MGPYLGDFVEDGTIHFMWDTSDVSGASITRATDGEVRVYKDNGVAQSTAGITDTEDFDSLTGVHACTILLTDAFYVVGSNYTVVLQGALIDGQTVNAVLAHFSIENRAPWVGTLPELAQAKPAAEPSMAAAMMLWYMILRNRLDISGGEKGVFNDGGTKIAEKALTDDGSIYSEAEMESGA